MASHLNVALGLGWAGVLPFVTSAVLVWAPSMFETAVHAILYYGAIILSFLGGVHWGIELKSEKTVPVVLGYFLSIVPSLVAFFALFLQTFFALLMLAIGFLGLLIYDRQRARQGYAPDWYAKLRLQLTTAVLFCLLSALIAVGMKS